MRQRIPAFDVFCRHGFSNLNGAVWVSRVNLPPGEAARATPNGDARLEGTVDSSIAATVRSNSDRPALRGNGETRLQTRSDAVGQANTSSGSTNNNATGMIAGNVSTVATTGTARLDHEFDDIQSIPILGTGVSCTIT